MELLGNKVITHSYCMKLLHRVTPEYMDLTNWAMDAGLTHV